MTGAYDDCGGGGLPPYRPDPTVEALKQQLAATIAERDRAVKDAALWLAVERAAKHLPTGWIVRVAVENGAGWVEVYDANGNETGFSDDRTLAEQIDAAIAAAAGDAGGV